jgi:hypothetical protein
LSAFEPSSVSRLGRVSYIVDADDTAMRTMTKTTHTFIVCALTENGYPFVALPDDT